MGAKEVLIFLLLFPWTLVIGLAVAIYRLLKYDRKRDLLQMKILMKALGNKNDSSGKTDKREGPDKKDVGRS